MRIRFVPCLLGVVVLAACGGGGSDAVPTTTEPVVATAPEALAGTPDDPAAGGAVVVLGGSIRASLAVTACSFDDVAPTGPEPVSQVDLSAAGVDDRGRPVEVSVRRFASLAAAVTVTDTATVVVGDPAAPETVLQAQRFEVDGLVSDGRDPAATASLLQVFGSQVRVEGLFAPPGNFAADGGLVEGVVIVSCR